MYRHLGSSIAASIAAAVALLVLPVDSWAGGHGGGGHGGGGHGGGGHGGGGHGGGGHGGGHYGGGHYGRGFYGGYYGWGWGYPGYYGGYSRDGYYGGYYDDVYSGPSYYRDNAPAFTGQNALIDVRLPADATLTVDGKATRQTGNFRGFETDAIAADQTLTRTFVATWQENSHEVKRTRTVKVRAGQRVLVDFSRESIQQEETAPERIEKVED
jgi:uncharacterized protein (TIGR03000 family)